MGDYPDGGLLDVVDSYPKVAFPFHPFVRVLGLAQSYDDQRGAAAMVRASGPIRPAPVIAPSAVLEADVELADVGGLDRRDHFAKPVRIENRVVLEFHVIPNC